MESNLQGAPAHLTLEALELRASGRASRQASRQASRWASRRASGQTSRRASRLLGAGGAATVEVVLRQQEALALRGLHSAAVRT